MSHQTQQQGQTAAEQTPLDKLTRRQLQELEQKKMTPFQKFLEVVIMVLPLVCGLVSVLEYTRIPDNSMNRNPQAYLTFLILLICAYFLCLVYAGIRVAKNQKTFYEKLRYRAPLCSALFLLLAYYDYLTLKTGILTQPFVPCLNFVINAFWQDVFKGLIIMAAVVFDVMRKRKKN